MRNNEQSTLSLTSKQTQKQTQKQKRVAGHSDLNFYMNNPLSHGDVLIFMVVVPS